jgi:molybdenum cofactor biosynthesis enzyme MoaA
MGEVTGQLIVKTIVKTTVCENCKGLRVSIQGKPHICPGRKGGQVAGSRVIVLGKLQTTVSVTAAE